jgi:hypothetical protein
MKHRFRATFSEEYYYISFEKGCVCKTVDLHRCIDNVRYHDGNYFEYDFLAKSELLRMKGLLP